MPHPCKLTFDLSGVRVTCDVGQAYFCANFSLPVPLCSRHRPDVRDRQTSDAHRSICLIHPMGAGQIHYTTSASMSNLGLREPFVRFSKSRVFVLYHNAEVKETSGCLPVSHMVTERIQRLFGHISCCPSIATVVPSQQKFRSHHPIGDVISCPVL